MSERVFQEISVQEGYGLWSATYDQEKNGLVFVEEQHVNRLLTRLTFTKVLDVGTGTGRHALKFARQGMSVTALDQSPQMLEVARQTAQREGLFIDFRLHSLEHDLPFKAQEFNLIVCALTLSHVPDLSHVLREFARVLQNGGYLLITDFHPIHLIYGWKTAFRREEVSYQIPTVGYTKDDYLKAITESDLTILDVTDSPVSEAPEGYLPEEMRRMYANEPLCLSILAQK